jgi:hypothetical protein
MTNGWRCWKVDGVRAVTVLVAVALLAAGGWWWLSIPRTPKELFQARCTTCHALPNLCVYHPERRPMIVNTMRQERGATEVIDDAEAQMITTYLRSELRCP